MAVMQRSLSSDTQKKVINFSFDPNVGKGHSGPLLIIPYPCRINALQMTCFALVDTPWLYLQIHRFIPSYGYTIIPFGTTFSVPIFGTSGVFPTGITLPVGDTLNSLAANDLLCYVCDAQSANGAINGLIGSMIVTPVQDQIKFFGLV